TAENLETLGGAGLSYDGATGAPALAEVLQGLLSAPGQIAQYRRLAAERVQQVYSWERVTDEYEALFHGLLGSA
ncbi:MAG: glycosyltransferase family 1 protein, partial [Chloroflexi bacterium]|nr:glycosyltransferase family 1 protein [Chloroflexota bacterium]